MNSPGGVQMGNVNASPGEPPQDVVLKVRPAELEDGLNRVIYHPLSRRLALLLQHTPVSPNMVSVTSFFAIVAATLCYTLVQSPAGIAAGLFFHALWHVIDGADGDLARLTGKTSPLGEMIDGLCDYAGHVILYTALAFSVGGWVIAAAVAAAASRIVQANHIESVRRIYQWRGYGIAWLGQSKDPVARPRGLGARLLGGLAGLYVGLAELLIPSSERTDRLVETLERAPATRDQARAVSRRVGRAALTYQFWLGSNRRTLLLGLSMALGSPGWYFLWECTILNLVLLASVAKQRRVNAALAAALDGVRPDTATR